VGPFVDLSMNCAPPRGRIARAADSGPLHRRPRVLVVGSTLWCLRPGLLLLACRNDRDAPAAFEHRVADLIEAHESMERPARREDVVDVDALAPGAVLEEPAFADEQ